MLVHFEDKDYQFDIEALDLGDARTIKRQTGLTIRKLMLGLNDLDPDALAALYWLMLKQNGIAADPSKVNFPILKFGEAIADAFERSEAEELGITVEELRARKQAEEDAGNPTGAEPAANQV